MTTSQIRCLLAVLALARTLETQRDDIALLFSRQFELLPDESAKAALALMSELTAESLGKLCRAK